MPAPQTTVAPGAIDGHPLADRLDDARELVTERDGQHGEHRAAVVLGGVAAAHAADRDPHERLARPGDRDVALLDAQVARRVQHAGAHAGHSVAPSPTGSCAAERSAIIQPRYFSYTSLCGAESR